MAILKINVIRRALNASIGYVQNPQKTESIGFQSTYGIRDTLTSGFHCSCDEAYAQMQATKQYFHKPDGILGYHFIQSFAPGEITPERAHQVGCEFITRCFGDYEVVISTHTDHDHIHNHIVVNSVSFVDGRKYLSTPASFYKLRGISDEICRESGLSVIQHPPKKSTRQYAEWRAEQKNCPTIRSLIREDIDVILSQARTLDEFWSLLRTRGYEIRLNEKRKYVIIRHPNGKRFIRLKSLGEDYTPRQLAVRIAAQRGSIVDNLERVKQQRQQLHQRKKYQVRPHTRAPKQRKKLKGFRAVYFRYLYLLGKVRRRKAPRVVRGQLLEELKKLERYTRQYDFLCDHLLYTRQDVDMYADALANEIYILTERRARLHADKRKSGSDQTALKSETQQLTAALRKLRGQLHLCADIQKNAPEIKVRLDNAITAQKRIEIEKGREQHESREWSSRSGHAGGIDADRDSDPLSRKRRGTTGGDACGHFAERETDFGKN